MKAKIVYMALALVLVFSLVAVVVPAEPVQAEGTIQQLTNNDYEDNGPSIDGGQVTWTGYDGNDYEIFLYDGTSTIQLTDNSYDDSGPYRSPQIDGGQVTWEGFIDVPLAPPSWLVDIFLYDIASATTIRLTTSSYQDSRLSVASPQIDAGQVTWTGYDGNDYEIFLYDISSATTTQLTDNSYDDTYPQIDAGQVTWHRRLSGSNYEVFLYDISSATTIQLTDNGMEPQIDGGQVTWMEIVDTTILEVFLYDIVSATTTQLTDNNYYDVFPQIDAGQVTWFNEVEGDDGEIFLYDGTSTIQLTDNSYDDCCPQIDAGQVTWTGYDGNDYEIVLYDIASATTTQLTDNSYMDGAPQIDGGQVTWYGEEGDGDGEIFLYTPTPDDGGEGCFIATAAYGTSTAAEIDILRAFRDEVLLESTLGSQLVEWYYQTSPPVADFISENSLLRTLVRELLVDPIASLVEATEAIWGD